QFGVVAGGGGADQRARGADLVAAAGLQAEVVVGGGGAGLQRRVTGAGLAAQGVGQQGDAGEAGLDACLDDAVGLARAARAGVHGLHDAAPCRRLIVVWTVRLRTVGRAGVGLAVLRDRTLIVVAV